jgi:AcrR family transcriptional regulator
MINSRSEVAARRRAQIVEAAVAIIAEKGLQKLSLSAIERRAGMSRGQLTYYFPAKENILLAVFDRLLELMLRRADGKEGPPCALEGRGWERLQHFLTFFLLTPPEAPEFHALQYTFLSQIGHREDFRARLASLYEDWRGRMAAELAGDLVGTGVSPRALATFVQAILHGLAMQRVADPEAFDRQEMLSLCLRVLGTVLGRPAGAPSSPSSNGAGQGRGGRPARPKRGRHDEH